MPTYAPSAVVDQLVAANALTQLNRQAIFPRAAIGNYEPLVSQRGDSVTVRRPKITQAEDYDPRTGVPAQSQEPGYVSATLTLDKLFTGGFPVYAQDSRTTRSRYVTEYGEQIASAVSTSADTYFYNKFRFLNVPAIGTVAYSAQPPVAMVVTEDENGVISDFNKYSLINANSVLDGSNVPANNRFSIISTAAKGSFLGDAILAEKFVDGFNPTGLITTGLPIGAFASRYGFAVGGSNAISYQNQVRGIDASTPNGISVEISAISPNVEFLAADEPGIVPLGAINITLNLTGALAGIAAGQIARLGPDNAPSTAYGLILRISNPNVVTLVPYSPKGVKLLPSQIDISTAKFSVPTVPSINVAYHRESLLFATRLLEPPSDGSGATMNIAADATSGLVVQVFRGNYKVDEFKESQRYATLLGAILSDYRKAVFILSA